MSIPTIRCRLDPAPCPETVALDGSVPATRAVDDVAFGILDEATPLSRAVIVAGAIGLAIFEAVRGQWFTAAFDAVFTAGVVTPSSTSIG